MSDYIRIVVAFTRANLVRFMRDKTFIFFFLALPVIFLVVFGMIHSNNFSGLNIAIFDKAETELSRKVTDILLEGDMAEEVEVYNREEAEELMISGEIHATVVFPRGFGEPNEQGLPSGEVEVIYSMNSARAGQMLTSIMDGIMMELDRQVTGTTPILTVRSEVLAQEGMTDFDYVFAGLLGYTVLTIGLMTMANVIPTDKKTGAIRRLRATILTKSQLILSYSITFLLLGVLVFLLMIGLGIMVFDFQMRGSWLNFSIFTLFATMMMLGFGLLVGGWAKNDVQASAVANALMFPMMFLSGVFFPLFLMPSIMQRIAEFIPLTPVVEGIRLIITENYSLLEIMPQIGMVAAWAVVVYAFAIRMFRWE